MDVALDTGKDQTPVATVQKGKGKKKSSADDEAVGEVLEFLTKWESAKIVVVVETHCLDTGVFVWKGDEPANYQTCSFLEVSICDLLTH